MHWSFSATDIAGKRPGICSWSLGHRRIAYFHDRCIQLRPYSNAWYHWLPHTRKDLPRYKRCCIASSAAATSTNPLIRSELSFPFSILCSIFLLGLPLKTEVTTLPSFLFCVMITHLCLFRLAHLSDVVLVFGVGLLRSMSFPSCSV